MMVCICNAVPDREILRAIREGARTPEELGQSCGAGTECGACLAAVAELLRRHEAPGERP
jgi:bacterioferritin-associated ferredoxin